MNYQTCHPLSIRPGMIAQGLFSYQIGGSERIAADLAIEFQRRGHNVVCFALYDSQGPVREELESRGIRCLDLNYMARRRLVRRATFQISFYKFLKTFGIDALLVHHVTSLMITGIPARLAHVPRIAMVEHSVHQFHDNAQYARSARFYCRLAHTVIGVDRSIINYFEKTIKVPREQLRYIPNGVRSLPYDSTVRYQLRHSLGIDNSCFVFLFAGRLHPVKDLPTLVSAVSHAVNYSKSNLCLLLVGDGPERTNLEDLVAAASLSDHVRFLGPRRDVRALMQASDAFVMTSLTEGQPMALIEAMATGLPCIATAVGGVPQLLGNGAGLLVQPKASSKVAEAMLSLIHDSALRRSLISHATRRVAALHRLETVANEYLRVLNLPAYVKASQSPGHTFFFND